MGLRYSIMMKLIWLTTHTIPTIQPSNFGQVLTNKSEHMAFYPVLDFRDPN